MKYYTAAVCAIALALGNGLGGARGDEAFPEELRVLRENAGCGPVPGYFDRPGMVEPPYLYGWLPGKRESSAAFWCFRGGVNDERPYLLVLVENGRISETIPWEIFPGGLSLHDSSAIPLSDFLFIDEPAQRSGPAGKMTEFPPLRSEYDGVITLFYRYDGRWLYRILH